MLIQAGRLPYPCQYTICALAWDKPNFRGSSLGEGSLQKQRFSRTVSEQIVAQAVDDWDSAVIFKALKNMRMAADNQIGARINIAFGKLALVLFRKFIMLDPPVDKDNSIVTGLFCLSNGGI